MPKVIKKSQTNQKPQITKDNKPPTEEFFVELTSEDVDLIVTHIIANGIKSFIELRQMSPEELKFLFEEHFQIALEASPEGIDNLDDDFEDEEDMDEKIRKILEDMMKGKRTPPYNPYNPYPYEPIIKPTIPSPWDDGKIWKKYMGSTGNILSSDDNKKMLFNTPLDRGNNLDSSGINIDNHNILTSKGIVKPASNRSFTISLSLPEGIE